MRRPADLLSRRTHLLALALAAGALAAVACGGQAAGAGDRPAVRLEVRYSDGAGSQKGGRLRCDDGDGRATGFLRRRPVRRLCRVARERAGLLASVPDTSRPCTEVYGGPDRARVTGRVGSRAVDRRFARADGCQIADWDRAQPLLPRPRGADAP